MQTVETQCPYCWETLHFLIDPAEAGSTIVEDCQVCCRPMELHLAAAAGDVVITATERAD